MRLFNRSGAVAVLHACGLVLVLQTGVVHASGFGSCSQQLYQQTPPGLQRDSLRRQSYPLCFNGFAVMYSGVSRTPLWSAEYLTPQRLKQAKTLDRQGDFHEEARVPLAYRSQLSDYSRSGYDRGHMAPNGDMANRGQQADSFSLANMVPQSPYNNQEVWRNLEEATRALVLKKRTAAYIVTGPVFSGQRLKRIGGKQGVLVPSHVFKAVYFPELNAASAYVAVNDQRAALRIVSIDDLQQLVGMDLFPAVPDSVKQQAVNLPVTAAQAGKASYDLWGDINPQYTQSLPAPDASASKPGKQSDQPEHAEGESFLQRLINAILNWLVDYFLGRSHSHRG